MFSRMFIAGFVLLLVGLFGGNYLAERSRKLLTSEEKLKLLDSFSRLRVFGSLPLLVVFLSYFGICYLPQGLMWPAYFLAWALVAVYFIVLHRYVFRKMREFSINADFLAAHNKARWVQYCGWIAFFILITLSPFV